MTEDEKQEVWNTVDSEGFDYAFTAYSSFDEIKDKKFHEIRKKYIKIQKELEDYIKPSDVDD